jgi:hypothetical protein
VPWWLEETRERCDISHLSHFGSGKFRAGLNNFKSNVEVSVEVNIIRHQVTPMI